MPEKGKSKLLVVLIITCYLGAFLAGCARLEFVVSVPAEIPAGAAGDISDETIRLELPGLKLSAQLQTYREKGNVYLSEPLGVWLNFDTGDEMFYFNPGRVLLTADNEEAMTPMTFLGPETAWQSPRAVAQGCGPRRYSLGVAYSRIDVSVYDKMSGNSEKGVFRPSGIPISFKGEQCFMLWFDTKASPKRNYVLSIQDTRKAGEPYFIPDIRFRKGLVVKYF